MLSLQIFEKLIKFYSLDDKPFETNIFIFIYCDFGACLNCYKSKSVISARYKSH